MADGIGLITKAVETDLGIMNEYFWTFPDGEEISINRPYDIISKFSKYLEAWQTKEASKGP